MSGPIMRPEERHQQRHLSKPPVETEGGVVAAQSAIAAAAGGWLPNAWAYRARGETRIHTPRSHRRMGPAQRPLQRGSAGGAMTQ
jgi:hypothetical protein